MFYSIIFLFGCIKDKWMENYLKKMKNENPATCAKRAMREVAALRRNLRNGKLYEKMKNENPATCAKRAMR